MRLGRTCECKEKLLSKVTKYPEREPVLHNELQNIVAALTAQGKGLLAADETPKSLEKRFEKFGIENTDVTRRDYREMLFTAEKSEFMQYISGVILNHETVYQKTSEGISFIELLKSRNIVSGVKVDRGLVNLFNCEGEKTTQGLDDLEERCIQYKRAGCHFAKWRCVFSISNKHPSNFTMTTNARVLARYASICQNARIVPIVEPEILNAGHHGINESSQIHEEVLSILFRALNEHKVYLEGMILKPSMVLSGIESNIKCKPQIVADYTLTTLRRTVPPAMPAILFLSGGQSDEDAILNLNAINADRDKQPWRLSFCFGRTLQNVAMETWAGNPNNVQKAQMILLEKAKSCSLASLGILGYQYNERCTKSSYT